MNWLHKLLLKDVIFFLSKGQYTMSQITELIVAASASVDAIIADVARLTGEAAPLAKQVIDLTTANEALSADVAAANTALADMKAKLDAAIAATPK